MRKILMLCLLVALVTAGPTWAQKKPAQKKPASTTKPGQKKPAPGTKSVQPKAGVIPPNQIDTFKQQVTPLVKFFESTLNFLADKRNPVNEKQTIITQSYLKFTWDEEVQVEDDLDVNRLVPLYKDMTAYLSDVDFFFRGAKFRYDVQDLSVQANEAGQTYFKVTANRNLKAITINGDSVNSNKVRYIEINYDETKQQLKIVSVYTTKLNEKDDLRRWWNSLSREWKTIFATGMMLDGATAMADVESYNDTIAMVGGEKTPIDGSRFYQFLGEIVHMTSIDVSGNANISDLEPLGKISSLTEINLAGTPVSDLMPLRNLNNLEVLDISNTLVATLEPLRYCTKIRELRIKGIQISDLSILPTFGTITLLDISGSAAASLADLADRTTLKDLRLAYTGINDLTPVSGLINLELLNIAGTRVSDLAPLSGLIHLRVLQADSTSIRSLTPLDGIAGLQRVYLNNAKVTQEEALNFLKKHPEASMVYKSAELTAWWSALPAEWKDLFHFYMDLGNPPTTEQLHKLVLLDSINLSGRSSIVSLEPLSELILLYTLQCQGTGITSFGPLKNLTELKSINASNTKISDLQPLAGLTGLQSLTLDNTGVADLDPLYGLKNLQMVYADNTQIKPAEANQFLDKLPGCMLVFQTYENMSWWRSLPQPWKEVLMQQANLKDTPDKIGIQQILNLDKVTISENFQITDLSPLVRFSRLKELQFSGTAVTTLAPVAGMPQLKALRCPKNPITTLEPLTGLPNLTELDFSNTQVEELVPLQNMMQLEILKFSGTPVKNLKYIARLINLKTLEFYNTRVSSLDVLDGMSRLESLKIFNTKVSEKKVTAFRQAHPKCEVVFY
jgi:Leucine-rich repeat (LRR) protein